MTLRSSCNRRSYFTPLATRRAVRLTADQERIERGGRQRARKRRFSGRRSGGRGGQPSVTEQHGAIVGVQKIERGLRSRRDVAAACVGVGGLGAVLLLLLQQLVRGSFVRRLLLLLFLLLLLLLCDVCSCCGSARRRRVCVAGADKVH